MAPTQVVSSGQRHHHMSAGNTLGYHLYGNIGPVVVLLHGLGANSHTWDPVVAGLVDAGMIVLVVDLPGHGQSSKLRSPYDLDTSTHALASLLDTLNIAAVTVVGHSYGGGVALHFFHTYPNKVDSLILVSSGGLGRDAGIWLRAASLPGSGALLAAACHQRTRNGAARLGRWLAWSGRRVDALTPEGLEAFHSVLGTRASRYAFLSTLRSVINVRGQKLSALAQLSTATSIPVTIMWGSNDTILPPHHGNDAAQLLPHANLHLFPGGGHDPHHDNPERFVALTVAHMNHVSSR